MLNSARHYKSLLRAKIDRPVFQIDQESAIDHIKKFVDVGVLVPMVFTFDNSQTHNRVVHFAQRLVPPFVFAIIDELLEVDQLQWPVQNVEKSLVVEIFWRLLCGHKCDLSSRRMSDERKKAGTLITNQHS